MPARKRYSSDLVARDWQQLEPLLVVRRRGKWPLAEVVNAILYVLKNGCVAGFAGRFAALGHGVLVFYQVGGRRHVAVGQHVSEGEQPGTGRKKAWATAVVLDTQSVQNASKPTGAPVGFARVSSSKAASA